MSQQRTAYRHRVSGDKGYLVSREGRDFILLDRPGDPLERPFRPDEWIAEAEHRPITPMQLTAITYAADRELCRALGLHALARREWLSVPERERIAFMQDGPPKGPRHDLWLVIRAQLKGLTGASST